jgi:hypothetical protein
MKGERRTMTNSTNPGSVRWLNGRASAVMLVVASVVAGILVATALASSGSRAKVHRAARKTGIAVFSHHPKLARIAKAGSLSAPSGAILAAVVNRTEVYVLQNASDEYCVMHLTVGAGGGSICAPYSQVEAQGEVGIGGEGEGATAPGSPAIVRVTALVPNGVTNVRFTDRDGSSYEVRVTNNVVEREDINIASVSYTLPGGGRQMMNVAAVVDHIPHQPGAAGSSRTASQ